MSTSGPDSKISRCTSILKFWHKVEFFIPFDLQQQVFDARDAEWSVRTFSERQLDATDVRTLWDVDVPKGRRLSGFEAFLGVFDKSELDRITARVVHETLTPEEAFDQAERGDLEGPTCFARIKLDDRGQPLLGEVSVSTAPWALGRIQQHGLEGLDFDDFQEGVNTLKQLLRNFSARRIENGDERDPASANEGELDETKGANQLTAYELRTLLEIFYAWAGYRPPAVDPDAAAIVVRKLSTEVRTKASAKNVNPVGPLGTDAVPSGPKQQGAAQSTDWVEEEDESADAADSEIVILNSFYAKDIERVIESLQKGAKCPALMAYLAPVPDAARIDLHRSAGRRRIADALQPSHLNRGHWLNEPQHHMSLMQQFAVNSALERLPDHGLFSVNGPPGTGKTTLLQELIAENLTRRARALAKLETAGEAFLRERVTVHIDDQSYVIGLLRPEVTGFEMVVASTNNAAVENISKELPKAKSLGKTRWRDERGQPRFTYLQPIAEKLAAKQRNGDYASLEGDEVPWGLISRALGKRANRWAFASAIRFPAYVHFASPPKGFDPKRHQSVWEWRDGYGGPSFEKARQAFRDVDGKVSERVKSMTAYAQLKVELAGQTEANFAAAANAKEQNARQRLAAAQNAFQRADEKTEHCERQLETLREEATLIEQARPLWWKRWFDRPAYARYREELVANHASQRELLRGKARAESERAKAQCEIRQAKSEHAEAEKRLAQDVASWKSKERKLGRLRSEFPQADQPEQYEKLEQDDWQIGGLWRDDALNGLRSDLFAKALQLHEAWLAEVLQRGGRFVGNVRAFCHSLSGKRLLETEHALALWQSLFMMVPVVSSTFASFADQFRHVEQNALGWLFVDEAGQAVPQAAAGALWRAKRAVVVGDPLQIEPVFTVPIKLIEALAKSSDLPEDMDVAPHRVSVQRLADAANPLGTSVSSQAKWIGSPLRVHRRCAEPMFSVANAIAYEGKMIFAGDRVPPTDSLDDGASAWVDVRGKENRRQAVPDQLELVHQAVVALSLHIGTLPPLYIISPFKRVKAELVTLISDPASWRKLHGPHEAPLFSKTQLRDWCRQRIGTVHTFQGKEESIVWMVLGCDSSTRGAAEWAAKKPNLINVALTRAKHRFFMSGDVSLWGGLHHFEVAKGRLPVIEPMDFLQRMQAAQISTAWKGKARRTLVQHERN